MVCDPVPTLPHPSVAVHVLVMLKASGQEPGVFTSAKVKTNPPHASVTVGVTQTGVAEQDMVVGPGNPERTGAVTSTVLVNV